MITHRLITVVFTVPVHLEGQQLVEFAKQALDNGDYVQVDNPTFERLVVPPEIAAVIQR